MDIYEITQEGFEEKLNRRDAIMSDEEMMSNLKDNYGYHRLKFQGALRTAIKRK